LKELEEVKDQKHKGNMAKAQLTMSFEDKVMESVMPKESKIKPIDSQAEKDQPLNPD
jgi:hypothetical protein